MITRWLQGQMNRTRWQSIYHENGKVDLMEETIIQMNGGTMINVDVSVKNVMYGKNIMFGIFLHVIGKMESI